MDIILMNMAKIRKRGVTGEFDIGTKACCTSSNASHRGKREKGEYRNDILLLFHPGKFFVSRGWDVFSFPLLSLGEVYSLFLFYLWAGCILFSSFISGRGVFSFPFLSLGGMYSLFLFYLWAGCILFSSFISGRGVFTFPVKFQYSKSRHWITGIFFFNFTGWKQLQ
jgi:hypothetical protein